MKRLFVKTAVNGGITAPDFAAGDPTVSARSAALRNAIQAGEQRFYLVYYRDPAVLGVVRASDPDVAAAVDAKDAKALRAIVELWFAGKRPLPAQDQETLRRAMKAFHKTLNATLLDAESGIGGRGMSTGQASSIIGIQPPSRFTTEVWNQLVREGRLRGGRHGVYELGKG